MNVLFFQVLFAFTIDLMVADPVFLPHPVRCLGFFIEKFELVLRRFLKGQLEFVGGLVLTSFIVMSSYFFIYLILSFSSHISNYLGFLLGTYFIYVSVACRELGERAKDVLSNLEASDLARARKNLSGLVGRDVQNLNAEEVGKAVIETVAENINDAVVAPLFFAFLGGAPMAFAYRAVNTLDSMVGYRNGKYARFGFTSAKLDDILNFIPARIVGLIFPFIAFILRKNVGGCIKMMLRDAKKHLSPNSGISEAAMAGTLGVQLGGLSFYGGKPVSRSKLGESLRPLTTSCVAEAIKIHYLISFFALFSFIALILVCGV
ncbi:MAG TPA: cobalamin biosynthesis protein CobD [Actinobacteria bacterium]|nr:cobalamin biosynthesis protein CobD [Actinomycetota bacterium]